MNPKIGGVPRIEGTNLGHFSCRIPFARFSLPKIRNRFGRLPQGILERAIQTQRTVHPDRLRQTRPNLRLLLVREGASTNALDEEEHGNRKCPS